MRFAKNTVGLENKIIGFLQTSCIQLTFVRARPSFPGFCHLRAAANTGDLVVRHHIVVRKHMCSSWQSVCVYENMYFRVYNYYIDLAPYVFVLNVKNHLTKCVVMFLENTCFFKNTCFGLTGSSWFEKHMFCSGDIKNDQILGRRTSADFDSTRYSSLT